MPWVIRERDGKHCLYKQGSDNEPTGEAIHCHGTRDEAIAQMRAMYAAEQSKSVKFVDGSGDEIEGLLAPWGGIHNGRDLDGQFFSNRTDFCLDWYKGDRPLLWNHGLDSEAQTEVVGRIKSVEIKADSGAWMRAQLDRQTKYFEAIRQMVKEGKLFLSSGAMAHLVQVDAKTGEILRWPLVEGSATSTPSNLLATVDYATVSKHYEAAGIKTLWPDEAKIPLVVTAKTSKPAMRQMMAEMVSEMGMEMSDDEQAEMIADMDASMPVDEMRATMRKKMQARKKQMPDGKAASLLMSLIDDDLCELLADWPITSHAEATRNLTAALSQRTKGLVERRIKEGRVISTMNRKRLAECLTSMRTAADDLQSLLDSTELQPAKAASVRRLHAQLVAQHMASLTLN